MHWSWPHPPTLSRVSGNLILKVQGQNWVLERWSVLRGATMVYEPPPATLIAAVSPADPIRTGNIEVRPLTPSRPCAG